MWVMPRKNKRKLLAGLLSFGSLTVSLHRKSPRVKKGCEWMVDGKEDEWKVTSSERLVNGGWEKISEKR